jgi:tetratricopeptide (TPR) repeat protein
MPKVKDIIPDHNHPLSGCVDVVKKAAIEIWHSPQHRHYTDHRPETHSERIIDKLDLLVAEISDPEAALSPEEAFILLASAYLHDIGMQSENSEWKTLDEIREHHHLISRAMIEGSVKDPKRYRNLGIPLELADEVALVSAAHRRLDLMSPEFETRAKGSSNLRLRLLSALLRLADGLDMDFRRVIMENLKVADVSQLSRLHWWRCHYVDGISIKNGVIAANCVVPSEDYTIYIKTSIERDLHELVEKVRSCLWPTIKLSVGNTSVRVSPTKEAMSIEDFTAFRAQVMSELEASSLNALNEIRDLHAREERTARLLVDEAKRIRDSDSFHAIELYDQAVKLYQRQNMHQSAADLLETIAQINEKHGRTAEAAEAYDACGFIWLRVNEPHRATHLFRRALELTPQDDKSACCIRQINLTQSYIMQGDFGNAYPLIQSLSLRIREDCPSFQPKFARTITKFLITTQQWPQALEQSRELIRSMENTPDVDPQFRFSLYYDTAIIASHAGRHSTAQELLMSASSIFNLEQAEYKPLALQLYSRRGYVRARSTDFIGAVQDFDRALTIAEQIGDDRSLIIQHDNLLRSAQPRADLHQAILDKWSKVSDLRYGVQLVQDEENDGQFSGSEQLYDVLAHYIYALHLALTENNLGGTVKVHRRLASLYKSAGNLSDALKLFMMVGDRTETEAICAILRQQVDPRCGSMVNDLILELGSTEDEKTAVGAATTVIADVLPSEKIEVTVERLFELFSATNKTGQSAASLVSALASLAEAMSIGKVIQCTEIASQLLADQSFNVFPLYSVALKLLQSLARRIPADIQSNIVSVILPYTTKLGTDIDAFKALMAMDHYFDQPVKDQIRDFMWQLAVDKRNCVAAKCVVHEKLGQLPELVALHNVNFYLELMRKYEQMAVSHRWDMSTLLMPSNLEHFKEYIKEDQIEEIVHLLIRLTSNPNQPLLFREDAAAGLGGLAEIVPGGLLVDAIKAVSDVADRLVIAPDLEELEQSAANPFERYKVSFGNAEATRQTALIALGKLSVRIKGNPLKVAIGLILKLAGDRIMNTRFGAAVALKYARPSLKGEDLRAAITQIYVLLHDTEPEVQFAATHAAIDFVNVLTRREAELFLDRLTTLSISDSIKVRIHTAYVLKSLAEHSSLARRKNYILETIQNMTNDVSFRVRNASHELIASIGDLNRSS